MDEKMVEIAFQLISHGGNARGMAMEAINAAKQNNIAEAKDLIKQAREEILNAHEYQTTLIQDEASGVKNELSILLVHAQDYLMTGMTVLDMAEEFVDVYERIDKQ